MPCIRFTKDRLTLLLGVNAAGDCKLRSTFAYHSENPRAPTNYAKGSLLVYYTPNNKAWMTADLFTKQFIEYCEPTVQASCLVKKIPFNIY